MYRFNIIFFILILSCQPKAADESDLNSTGMQFSINPELLGELHVDSLLAFSFQPPKECIALPEDMQQKIIERINSESKSVDVFRLDPRSIFMNPSSSLICMLSIMPEFVVSDSLINKYMDLVKTTKENMKVNQSIFDYNNLKIVQNLIIGEERVQFSLFIPQGNNKSFQIDYIISRTIYESNIKTIESSIGSIKKI